MAKPKSAVKTQTSNMTHKMAGVDVFDTLGLASLVPALSFMTPVELAMASTPDKARTTPTKPFQFVQNPPVSGCTLCTAVARCGSENTPNSTTTMAVGTETKKASPPVCLGPKMLSIPIIAIEPAA